MTAPTVPPEPDRSVAEASASPTSQHPAPASSVWPAAIAAGLTLAFFGLVVWTPAFSVVGVAALVWGIIGWVRELLDGSAS